MYNEYFGFREKPFNITPDPRFFYATSQHEEAYANLFYGIRERKGFTVLTGEVGTGKTTLLRRLIDNLENSTRFVFFYNTTLSFEELLDFSFSELSLEVPQGGRLKKIQALNQFLISELAQGAIVTLLIDEAQNLSDDVLENLRLLSNLETAQEKLLQIVLVGQPELDTKLAQPHLRQLRQRITTRCHLARLRDAEVGAFITHRLRTVGYEDPGLFSPDALQRLVVYCQGIPRLINVICDSALLIAYGASQKIVTPTMVDEVARDLQLPNQLPRRTLITDTDPVRTQSPARPYQGEKPVPVSVHLPQTKVQGTPGRTSELPLKPTLKERQILRSPYAKQRLVWASVFAMTLLYGVIVYGNLFQEWELNTKTKEENKASPPTPHGIVQVVKSLNERLAEFLTPLLSTTKGQLLSDEASRVAIAQEVAPLPVLPDHAPSFTRPADVAFTTTDSTVAQDSQHEESGGHFASPSRAQGDERASSQSLQGKDLTQAAAIRPPSGYPPQERHVRSLQPGETISTAIREVYGNYNSLALDLIKEWNPQIEDLNRVAAGQKVWFLPLTLETLLRAQEDGTYHLIVATFRNAASAEQFARTLRERGHNTQIMSQQVSESILLYRVEVINLPSRIEAQQVWHVVNPTNVFFVNSQNNQQR